MMSVLSTIGFLVFGTWKFVIARSSSGLAVGSFALGSALLVLVAATYLSYAVASFSVLRLYGGTLVLPALVFFGVFAYALIKRSAGLIHLLLFGAVGFIGLCFFGFYASLLVACSFGDCL